MNCVCCGADLPDTGRGRPRRYCGRSCQARAYRARRDGAGSRRAPGPRPRRALATRGQLDRATVVLAAVRLADAEGLSAVSMRELAARLDIAAMSLYQHVSGKDDLVGAMVDAALAGYRPPDASAAGWRSLLEHEARQEWAVYRRHPWLLRVLATTRPPLVRSVLEAVDRSMTAVAGHGLDHRTALSVYLLVSGYVQGTALMGVAETETVRETGVSGPQWWNTQLGRLAGMAGSGHYPWLSELATAVPDGDDLESWFEFGLHRVLDGIAVLLADATGTSA
ncbi:TetR/AcrR family transcriptional regulator [Amycolatopsis anabasis]|uniref:TetR/AcrR family transcriptional regulator n=1 Tax=Amycolatopsis anabasis TaxID=1840409 RepID=UPI00131BB413|nr:TetR/AcrR family transcriptional regulator [Amycolatopsis anabasis]